MASRSETCSRETRDFAAVILVDSAVDAADSKHRRFDHHSKGLFDSGSNTPAPARFTAEETDTWSANRVARATAGCKVAGEISAVSMLSQPPKSIALSEGD